ncbi:hypothetical protein TNCV_1184251 [Trichonephila clavipes]|nr:hypothetical protein TNCV_1184251 [Trichonephila clavipes]
MEKKERTFVSKISFPAKMGDLRESSVCALVPEAKLSLIFQRKFRRCYGRNYRNVSLIVELKIRIQAAVCTVTEDMLKNTCEELEYR